MTGRTTTLAALAAAALMTVAGSSTPAAGQTPAPKLQPAFRGEAQVEMTSPQVKRTEKELVTTFKVKNMMKQPLAGFKIEEFWYDAKGTVVGGDTFRNPKPIQPDQIIEVKLTDPLTGKERNNNYKFSHANGTVKPQKVAKLP
jgi:uncharacterized protein YcfL